MRTRAENAMLREIVIRMAAILNDFVVTLSVHSEYFHLVSVTAAVMFRACQLVPQILIN